MTFDRGTQQIVSWYQQKACGTINASQLSEPGHDRPVRRLPIMPIATALPAAAACWAIGR